MRRTTCAVATLATLVVACGGNQRAAEAPPAGGYASQPPAQQQNYPMTPSAGASAPAPSPMPAEADSVKKVEPTDSKAPATAPPRTAPDSRGSTLRREVEAANRELELAGSNCAAACRALGSMERATARLCTLEEASCEDVRVRLRRARERVRSSCGVCSGGPSVDPDAPIPSR